MVSPFLFSFFLELKFSTQWCLRQVLFDIKWITIRGDILKKLCTSHHASKIDSTHISEKTCPSTKKATFSSIGRLEWYTIRCKDKWKSEKWNFGAFHLHRKVKIWQPPPAYKYLGTREIQLSHMLKLILDCFLFHSHVYVKSAGAIFFSWILCSHKCGIIFKRFHVLEKKSKLDRAEQSYKREAMWAESERAGEWAKRMSRWVSEASERAGMLRICYRLDGAARQLVANPEDTLFLKVKLSLLMIIKWIILEDKQWNKFWIPMATNVNGLCLHHTTLVEKKLSFVSLNMLANTFWLILNDSFKFFYV